MKRKILVTILAVILVVLVAVLVYPRFNQNKQTDTTAMTTAETTETVEVAATTEATEPETIPAPDFTVLDWDGNQVNFSDFAGKPIVLNFWTHWCGPCQMEMPEFNAAYERLEGEVTFLMVHEGAAVDDGKEKVTEGGYTFPVVFDVDSSVGDLYGITAYPTSFFIDQDGNLQAYYVGAMDAALLQQGLDLIYTQS